jgi:hypothetical protein
MSKQLAILTLGILVVLANPDLVPTDGRAPSKKPFQSWVKKGRIIAPGFAGPQSQSRVSAPSVVRLKNGQLRMYFWATGRGHHYICRGFPQESLRLETCQGTASARAVSRWKYQRQGTQFPLGDPAGRPLAHVLRHLGVLGTTR